MLLWIGVTGARGADTTTTACAAGVGVGELDQALGAVEASWSDLDSAGFEQGYVAVWSLVPCLREALPASSIARLHRVEALARWTRGDRVAAVGSLRAAQQLEPDWQAPPQFLPNELLLAVAHDPAPALGEHAPPPPRRGELRVDGAALAPSNGLPAVVQWLDGPVARGSWYIDPGSPLPDYGPVARSRNRVLLGSLVGVAIGGGLYGAAFASGAAFDALPADVSRDRAEAVQRRTNALTAGGVALMGLGAVGAGVAFTLPVGGATR